MSHLCHEELRSVLSHCQGASEVLAERWTLIIIRNLLLGNTTFNEISAGAPGLSRRFCQSGCTS